jgi:hypothetical protein
MVEKTSTKKRKKDKENTEVAALTKKVKSDENSFDIHNFRVKLHSKDFIWGNLN